MSDDYTLFAKAPMFECEVLTVTTQGKVAKRL